MLVQPFRSVSGSTPKIEMCIYISDLNCNVRSIFSYCFYLFRLHAVNILFMCVCVYVGEVMQPLSFWAKPKIFDICTAKRSFLNYWFLCKQRLKISIWKMDCTVTIFIHENAICFRWLCVCASCVCLYQNGTTQKCIAHTHIYRKFDYNLFISFQKLKVLFSHRNWE